MVAVLFDVEPVVARQELSSLEVEMVWVSLPVELVEFVDAVEAVPELAVEDEAAVAVVAVEAVAVVDPVAVCTASAPVMARKEPTLTAAAVLRAFFAGWGRLRRRAGAVGAGGVGMGLASMGTTVALEPGRIRRTAGDRPGNRRRR